MKKVRIRTCILLCLVCILSTATIMAGTGTEKITAFLNYKVNILLNDEVVELVDADGNRVYPITYEGTTYVPLRGVSNLLGIKVEWDGKNGNVLLYNTDQKSLITNSIKDTTYSTLFTQEEITNLNNIFDDFKVKNGFRTKQVSSTNLMYKNFFGVDLESEYKSISFDGYSEYPCSINIFNQNGKLIKTFFLSANSVKHYSFTVDTKENNKIFFIVLSQANDSKDKYTDIYNLYAE